MTDDRDVLARLEALEAYRRGADNAGIAMASAIEAHAERLAALEAWAKHRDEADPIMLPAVVSTWPATGAAVPPIMPSDASAFVRPAQPAPLPREPETCERHGCRIVNHTLVCGAPQCCPECCKEAADMDKPQPAPLPARDGGPLMSAAEADAIFGPPAQPAPLPGPVADAVGAWRDIREAHGPNLRLYGDDETAMFHATAGEIRHMDRAADALAAHATARRERDARIAALLKRASGLMWDDGHCDQPLDGESSVGCALCDVRTLVRAAAAELAGNGGGA